MAVYIYNTATGTLYSYNPNDADPVASQAVLTANGLTAISGLAPLSDTVAWDAATKAIKTVVAPTPARLLTTYDFINAFTGAELAAIRASADNRIQQFLFALQVTQGVNLNAASITQALDYLVTKGLLTQQRGTIILATVGA